MFALKVGQGPEHFLELISKQLPAGAEFEFGLYQYIPKETRDYRYILRISGFNPLERIEDLFLDALKTSSDLAIHSKIYAKDQLIGHIPMIDLVGTPSEQDLINIRMVFREFGIAGGSVFGSGRSFHIYGSTLISPTLLSVFFGRLLLLNDINHEIIDSRWIGHRLMAGYGALRLTKNSTQYLSKPKFITSL